MKQQAMHTKCLGRYDGALIVVAILTPLGSKRFPSPIFPRQFKLSIFAGPGVFLEMPAKESRRSLRINEK
jgi:hypothetical protein